MGDEGTPHVKISCGNVVQVEVNGNENDTLESVSDKAVELLEEDIEKFEILKDMEDEDNGGSHSFG